MRRELTGAAATWEELDKPIWNKKEDGEYWDGVEATSTPSWQSSYGSPL